MSSIDITSKIERLEMFEDRLGVRLSALSASIHEDAGTGKTLFVGGEIRLDNGRGIERQVAIVAAAYDVISRVVARDYCVILNQDFLGFETFYHGVCVPVNAISKLRLYPAMP